MALNESHDEVLPIGEELVKILPELRLFARSRTYSVHDADDLVSKACVRIAKPDERLCRRTVPRGRTREGPYAPVRAS